MLGPSLIFAASAAMLSLQGGSELARHPERAIGLEKAALTAMARNQDASVTCTPVSGAEVPTFAVEACRFNVTAEVEGAFLLVSKQGQSRVIAASIKAKAPLQQAYADELSGRLGQPLRVVDGQWGRSAVWLQGGRQVSLRPACAAERLCVEVSADTFARRVARSTGLFVPAPPGA